MREKLTVKRWLFVCLGTLSFQRSINLNGRGPSISRGRPSSSQLFSGCIVDPMPNVISFSRCSLLTAGFNFKATAIS